MGMLVANCPRCGARNMTFDVRADIHVGTNYGWQRIYELFAVCRSCQRSTVFVRALEDSDAARSLLAKTSPTAYPGALTEVLCGDVFICVKDLVTTAAPDHCPTAVEAAFREGTICLAVECFNAAGAMLRRCVDLATRPMVEEIEDEILGARTRRDLGLRLPWLFDHGYLPGALRELSTCIQIDANGDVQLSTLGEADAKDLLDFTASLLECLYTEPRRFEFAQQRRLRRHSRS
jgi:hypothetical protein